MVGKVSIIVGLLKYISTLLLENVSHKVKLYKLGIIS